MSKKRRVAVLDVEAGSDIFAAWYNWMQKLPLHKKLKYLKTLLTKIHMSLPEITSITEIPPPIFHDTEEGCTITFHNITLDAKIEQNTICYKRSDGDTFQHPFPCSYMADQPLQWMQLYLMSQDIFSKEFMQ
jgi:hypothetical protein